MNKAQKRQKQIEDFLSENFAFRYNTIKGRYEYCPTGEDTWAPVNDRIVNSMIRLALQKGLQVSKTKLNDTIESDFSIAYDPLKSYFTKIDKRYGTELNPDTIKSMARTVKTDSKKFEEYFRRWLIASVANVFEPGCRNHTMLVLSGEQGLLKTTWIENICPPDLRNEYLYSGKIILDSKDTLSYLAEFFIINIDDQLTQLNRRDENDIKNLITINAVKYRKPYAHHIEEYPRVANFTATVNQVEFLTDPTGSRRFLAFSVKDIDLDVARNINIDHMWAEAYSLYLSGERYWFDRSEIQELSESNSAFEVSTLENELIKEYLLPYQPDWSATGYEWQTFEILNYLKSETGITNLSERKLGQFLTKNKFKKYQVRDKYGVRKWVYLVYKRRAEKFYHESAANADESKAETMPF